jgi:hypothetical protein
VRKLRWLLVAAHRYLTGRPLAAPHASHPYLTRGAGLLAGWQRQLLRIGVPTVLTLLYLAAATYPAHTRAAALAVLVVLAVVVRRRWKRRRFRRTYVSPTERAIRVPMGTADVQLHVDPGLGRLVARLAKPLSPAEEWVRDVYGRWLEPLWKRPTDLGTLLTWALWRHLGPYLAVVALWFRRPRSGHTGPQIRLTIAAPFVTAEQRSMISAIVKAKVPAGDLVESWDQVGAEVTATWVPRKRPPTSVGLPHLEAHFARLREAEFYLGQGPGDVSVVISLDADSPHIAESAGSGAGKSVLAQLIAVQVLRRGGLVVLLDVKGSHRWAIGLDGVDYCVRPEQMHQALLREAAEASERNLLAMHEPEGWDPGPRTLIIAEELNATINLLSQWWADVRDKSDPKRCPSITALNNIAFMGRSAKKNLLAIAQMLTARAIGGPEARENFGIRCLARYTANNWKMLVPEAGMPRSSRTLGRWQIVVGGIATETQVCYLTHAQARAFARVPGRANGLDGAMSSGVTGNGAKPVTEPDLVTLAEAIDIGLIPWAKGATKMRMKRAREAGRQVPEPQGKRGRQAGLYDRAELAAWVESERTP